MDVVLDPSSAGDTGIPAGRQLLAFANAVEAKAPHLDDVRAELLTEVGADGVLEAAATIAIFNGLIRVADGTGIQLDDGLKDASAGERGRLGINDYAGAASTPDAVEGSSGARSPSMVQHLFS